VLAVLELVAVLGVASAVFVMEALSVQVAVEMFGVKVAELMVEMAVADKIATVQGVAVVEVVVFEVAVAVPLVVLAGYTFVFVAWCVLSMMVRKSFLVGLLFLLALIWHHASLARSKWFYSLPLS